MVADTSGTELNPTDWLRHAAQHHAGQPALQLGDNRFDYATLHTLAARLCQVLKSKQLKPGSTILVESRSATLLAFLLQAALIGDYVLCPLDPRLPDSQRQRLHERLNSDLMVIDEDAVRPRDGVLFVTATALLAQAAGEQPLYGIESGAASASARLLLASSGSGGRPALIKLSDRNLQASAEAVNERVGLNAESVWLGCLPLTHIGGLSIPLRCLRARAMVVLHERFDPEAGMFPDLS